MSALSVSPMKVCGVFSNNDSNVYQTFYYILTYYEKFSSKHESCILWLNAPESNGLILNFCVQKLYFLHLMKIRSDTWASCTSKCLCVAIDLVAQRGEKLELLIDKTENLVDSVSVCVHIMFAWGHFISWYYYWLFLPLTSCSVGNI